MEIAVLAVGRLKAGPERELCERYLDRARKSGRSLGFRGFQVQELAEGRGARAAERVSQEEQAIMAALGPATRAICLDEDGEAIGSAEFAQALGDPVHVARCVLVIGGPDGLGKAMLERADRRISFGRLTWPHQIVRILLAEQLYRAMTILAGHPYHRA